MRRKPHPSEHMTPREFAAPLDPEDTLGPSCQEAMRPIALLAKASALRHMGNPVSEIRMGIVRIYGTECLNQMLELEAKLETPAPWDEPGPDRDERVLDFISPPDF